MKPIRIDRGRVIPVAFSFLGTFLLFLTYLFLYENLSMMAFSIIGILISPLMPMIWTMRTITEINPRDKYVHEFIWTMGLKFGKPIPYDAIEKMYVNKVKMAQRMTSWSGQVHTSKFYEYAGYLKFRNGEKIPLVRDKERDFVFKKMEKISIKLNSPLIDNTSH